jgi:hypothetical protein
MTAQPKSRIPVLILVALSIMVAAFGVVIWWQPGTLATETFEFDGTTYECSIRNRHGDIDFMAQRRRGWSSAGHSLTRLGDAAELGTDDPQIVYDSDKRRADVRVGKGRWVFDPLTSSLLSAD